MNCQWPRWWSVLGSVFGSCAFMCASVHVSTHVGVFFRGLKLKVTSQKGFFDPRCLMLGIKGGGIKNFEYWENIGISVSINYSSEWFTGLIDLYIKLQIFFDKRWFAPYILISKFRGNLRHYAVVAAPICCFFFYFIKRFINTWSITNIFLSQSQVKVKC